jgi:hypothetical protein
MGLVLDPPVARLVARRTHRAAAAVEYERNADTRREHCRRARRSRRDVDAELPQKEVVVGGRAHGDANEIGIGADDEPAALEAVGELLGARRPDDHEIRVCRRRVEAGRGKSRSHPLSFGLRRA